ncbi:hypothetical protein PVK06_044939 [Gossypium arboreum]|uniref:Reverse transcriptase domain-containing protein n=1 Tax=Gossypium arboreum TaxID=29729 RepID=A0ABR0MV60_GOSAR|nr:hypothetical protein PVK06_044939 [Gossypium arboreum]
MVEQEDKQILPHQEFVETINLGAEERKQEVKIGTSISRGTRHNLIALLREYKDVFAWSYQDMPGLDEDVVVHKLPLKPEYKPIQQKLRRMRPEMLLKIKEEVKKQFDVGFLQTSKYPEWVANIVPVPKKDGKVRMCVDYRDLNRASPKDNFPLPHIDTLVDNTAKHSLFSFMDGFSGYNQIKMALEDIVLELSVLSSAKISTSGGGASVASGVGSGASVASGVGGGASVASGVGGGKG